jgi:hypothetical protein
LRLEIRGFRVGFKSEGDKIKFLKMSLKSIIRIKLKSIIDEANKIEQIGLKFSSAISHYQSVLLTTVGYCTRL